MSRYAEGGSVWSTRSAPSTKAQKIPRSSQRTIMPRNPSSVMLLIRYFVEVIIP